ncbi:flagellar protein FlaG [Robertmurraya sp. GLU-23]
MLERIISTSSSASPTRSNNTVEGSNEVNREVTVVPKFEVSEEKFLNDEDKNKVSKVVEGLNDFLTPAQTSLKFEYHEDLNEYYVTLVDDKTNEVVREIPSKKLLDIYAAMKDYIGIMIDKKI